MSTKQRHNVNKPTWSRATKDGYLFPLTRIQGVYAKDICQFAIARRRPYVVMNLFQMNLIFFELRNCWGGKKGLEFLCSLRNTMALEDKKSTM